MEDTYLVLSEGVVLTYSDALKHSSVAMRMSSLGSRELDVCTFESGKMTVGFVDNGKHEGESF